MRYRHAACSQPQPISITCDFSASRQYSPQYLLPSSIGQSQAPCAHLPVDSSAMRDLLKFSSRTFQLLGDGGIYARPDVQPRQEGTVTESGPDFAAFRVPTSVRFFLNSRKPAHKQGQVCSQASPHGRASDTCVTRATFLVPPPPTKAP